MLTCDLLNSGHAVVFECLVADFSLPKPMFLVTFTCYLRQRHLKLKLLQESQQSWSRPYESRLGNHYRILGSDCFGIPVVRWRCLELGWEGLQSDKPTEACNGGANAAST